MLNELNLFEATHGQPLGIGMLVIVDPESSYAPDWRGKFLVTGIQWDPHRRRFNITVSEDWADGGMDGWRPQDLKPAP